MNGTSAIDGRALSGDAHLIQSCGDILGTPIGSRVMREDYGSYLPELVDAPWGPLTRLRCYAATAQALQRWEPRIRLRKVGMAPIQDQPGAFLLDLEGDRVDALGRTSLTRFSLPIRAGSAGARPNA